LQNNDLENFSKLIETVFLIYGKDVDSVIDIYFNALSGYTFEKVKDALSKYIKNPDTGTYLPKPSDIIKILEGDSRQRSLAAWDKAFKSISRYGCNVSVIFDDEIIHAVISDMGGWISFCMEPNESNKKFIEKEFCRRYEYYLNGWSVKYPKILYGILDTQNSSNGYKSNYLEIVGDKNKALEIYGKQTNEGETQKLFPRQIFKEIKIED
jgi:hypothetical protein